MVAFGETYADQNERDYQALRNAAQEGRIAVHNDFGEPQQTLVPRRHRTLSRNGQHVGERGSLMSTPFKGTINIDIKDSVPDWAPYAQPLPPEDAPNVLYIVLDDVGFSAMESFGGLIETPNIKRIADRGLLYTNFHTTALCSPTRSCLLTGP